MIGDEGGLQSKASQKKAAGLERQNCESIHHLSVLKGFFFLGQAAGKYKVVDSIWLEIV